MNIVEVYNKYKEQLIIIVSGLSGSGKRKIAENISKDFKMKMYDMEDYCISKEKNTNIVKLSNGVKITDWDDINSYDWDKFNTNINEDKKQNMIVICGPYFPQTKLKFEADFHLHVKISKKNLVDKRHEILVKIAEKDDTCDAKKILDTDSEYLIIDKITYPHYIEYLKDSKIDKYLNANEMTNEQICDNAFSYLIHMIQKFVTENKKDIDEKLFKMSTNEVKPKNEDNEDNEESLYIGSGGPINSGREFKDMMEFYTGKTY